MVPISGIGMTTIGTPRRASSSVALVISGSCSSGATVQLIAEKIGRSRRLAPATASSMSTSGATNSGPRTSSCRCLLHSASEMYSISRLAVSGSRSRAESDGHT